MNDTPIPAFVLVSCIFFAAGIVKGVLGMGLPTLAMGLLGLLMPVPQAASLLTLPSLATNLWQALVGGALPALVKKLWPLQAGIVAGVAGAGLLPPQQDGTARMLLGACLLAYGASSLAGWRPRAVAPGWQGCVALAVGAATGVITGITGVFVIPAVPYLQTLQLDRKDMVQALGLCFTTSTLALAVLLSARGHLGFSGSLQSAFALAPALAGMLVGQKLRDWMSEASFRRCFFGGMALLGAWLLLG